MYISYKRIFVRLLFVFNCGFQSDKKLLKTDSKYVLSDNAVLNIPNEASSLTDDHSQY